MTNNLFSALLWASSELEGEKQKQYADFILNYEERAQQNHEAILEKYPMFNN